MRNSFEFYLIEKINDVNFSPSHVALNVFLAIYPRTFGIYTLSCLLPIDFLFHGLYWAFVGIIAGEELTFKRLPLWKPTTC